MLPTFLDKLGGFFDRRFIIAFWVPVFACALIVAGTWISLRGVSETLRRWDTAGVTWTTAILFGTFFVISLLAFLLQAFQTSLVRLYVGYWPIGFFRRWGEQREELLRTAAFAGNVEDWFYAYSRGDIRKRPQATRLGNIIMAAYDYPDEMYGANAANWWSRLTAVLPESFRTQVDGALTPLFALLNLCTALLVATFFGSLILASLNQRWGGILVYLLAGVALARICYYAAIKQAIVYGEHVRVAFDLYRGELLKHMRIKLPESANKEHTLWQTLGRWTYGYVVPWQPSDEPLSGQAPPQSEELDFYYDNQQSAPEAEETSIALAGSSLITISTKRVKADSARAGKDNATVTPAQQPTEASAEPQIDATPTLTGWQRFQRWRQKQWMGFVVLLLLVAIGVAEIWWSRYRASSPMAVNALQGLHVLSLPADQGVRTSAGEEVIVFGVKAAAGGTDEVSMIAENAISLGEQNGRLLLALEPQKAKTAAAYLIESRRLIVLRKLGRAPTPN
jgi:hypothetical protein